MKKKWGNSIDSKFNYLILSLFTFLLTTSLSGRATEVVWPKIIKNTKGELTVYQPQPESLDGTFLSGRAAISIKLADAKRPVFGAIWITSSLVIDRDTRIATLTNIKVPTIRFSDDVDSTGFSKLRKMIEEEMPKWDIEVSVDELITTLESTSKTEKEQFKNDPPEIIIAKKPSILVLIDGEPILKDLPGYNYKRIENSAFFIINDPGAKQYYLYGNKMWYSASDIKGSWAQVKNPSANLVKLQEEIEKSQNEQNKGETETPTATDPNVPAVVPAVILRTKPAELIVTDGEPNFVPVPSTNLLYVKNSENNVFMDIKSQSYFILISGRWYSSANLNGPWAFVDAEKLPDDFTKIPEGSDMDVVLASVPGTKASKEAILDSQIPQTAEVDRKTATVTVEYDGEPKFEPVAGTTMYYAVNSPKTVLKLMDGFFCVDNGIWFQSSNPRGPWKVAEKRPVEVDKIEPSSPVYNVKYVYIYDVTPDVIYVGYTPGYYGCYVYGPTVIYGTGYYYNPWYGAYYYPRPVTYGFAMHYNPWTGWGMTVGNSFGGFIHVGFGGGYHGGYWGPPIYRPPYYHHHGGGYYGGNARRPVQYNNVNIKVNKNNIYGNNRGGVKPNVSRNQGISNIKQNIPSSGKNNNVFTDKSGQVYQKTDKGWQTRQGNDWKSVDSKPATGNANRPSTSTTARPATNNTTRPSTTNTTRPSTANTTRPVTSPSTFDKSSMDKASQSRDRGATRTGNYSSYSSASSKSSAAAKSTKSSSGGRRK
jgi:hypothetical protein